MTAIRTASCSPRVFSWFAVRAFFDHCAKRVVDHVLHRTIFHEWVLGIDVFPGFDVTCPR